LTTFHGTDFAIELPAEVTDESTYVFAFPARSQFRPSLVVKTERLTAPVALADYVEKQLETIKSHLVQVVVLRNEPVEHLGLNAHGSLFDWGDAARRVRQKQRYILLDNPLRVVTITATHLQESFGAAEALFDAIFMSFKPGGPSATA
jgi:hypothetical protein